MATRSTFTTPEMADMKGRVEVLRKQSRWNDMAELQLKMLSSKERTLGKEHPDTLAMMHDLAITYSNGKQLKKAAEIFRPLYEARRKQLGLENRTTMVTMHYLAATCTDLNRLDEAEALHKELLPIRKRILGEEHVDTLRTMQYLAVTCGNLGKLTDARDLYEEMLPIRRRKLGNDHAATILVMNNLSVTYTDLQQFDKAEALHREVLAFRTSRNGLEHKDTLRTAYYLVTTYVGLKKWLEAEKLLLEMLPSFDRVLGKSHSYSMIGMSHLASIYERTGRWSEAERYETELLDRRKRNRGDSHPDTLATMKSLSIIYQQQRRWREADALEDTIDRLSLDSPSLGSQTSWYSAITRPAAAANEPNLASQSFDDFQSIDTMTTTKFLGPNHPEAIACLEGDAISLREQKRWLGAETILTEVLARRRQVQGDGHPFTIQTMSNLASVYQSQGKAEDAISLFQTALTILEQNPSALSENIRADMHNRLSALHNEIQISLQPPQVPGNPERGKRLIITSAVTPEEIMSYLTNVRCPDLTQSLDESKCGHSTQCGGFGEVLQGALKDGRIVALKYIRGNNDKRLKYLARELYTWSKTQHRNVLELFGLAHFRGNIVMVSPWMEFGNLRDYLEQNKHINRLSVAIQVVEGVVYLHNVPMIHGDLKADNIFVSKEGAPKIGDFGTSSFQGDGSIGFSSTVNKSVGTLRWMAPEMFTADSACSREADVYALGMTILEIFTGRVPYYEYENRERVIGTVIQGKKPTCPRELFSEPKLWALLNKCWHQEPRERPTADKVLQEVLQFEGDRDGHLWTFV